MGDLVGLMENLHRSCEGVQVGDGNIGEQSERLISAYDIPLME